MIPPILNYTVNLTCRESAYSLFSRINDLDLSDNLFDYNTANLVAVMLENEPVVYKFRNQRYVLGRSARYGSTYLIATFHEVNGSTTVEMRVCTNPVYYAYYGILLIYVMQAVLSWSVHPVHILITILFMMTLGLDVFSKAGLLARVKSVVAAL